MGLFRKNDYEKGLKAYQAKKINEAKGYWENGVNNGNADCMYALGSLYCHPDFGMVDEAKAFSYFLMAAERGHKFGLLYAGERLVYGNGTEKDPKRGLEFLRMAVSKGMYNAKKLILDVEKALSMENKGDDITGEEAYKLALSYLKGEGVGINYDKGYEMLKKAAEKGNADAISDLADCYFHGVKVKKNIPEAFRLYEIAAGKEFGRAQYVMAVFYFEGLHVDKNMAEGLKWLKKSADNGYHEAQLMIGDMYLNGREVPCNPELGVSYLKKAEQQNNYKASLLLGHCYYYGIGTEKDYEAAHYNLKIAYLNDVKEASLLLGYLKVFHSKGTRKDYDQGFSYFNDAEKLNLPGACAALGYCYDRGIGTDNFPHAAEEYYKKALDDPRTQPEEYTQVCYNLAVLYGKRKQLSSDIDKSIFYFIEASKRGDNNATLNLGLLYYYGVKIDGKVILAKDDSKAFLYLKSALEEGNEKAARYLKSDLSGLLPRYQVGLGEKIADVFDVISSELIDAFVAKL